VKPPSTLTRSARSAVLVTELLMAALVLYAVSELVLRGAGSLIVFSAVVSVVTAALLWHQRHLLRGLFAGRAVSADDGWLRRYRLLYAVVIVAGLLLWGVYLLALLVPGAVGTPQALLLILIAWGASLYATYGTAVALARLFTAPEDAALRASAREWLGRNALASGVFAVMNLVPVQGTERGPLVLTAAYALVAVLDVAWPLLTRAALRRP